MSGTTFKTYLFVDPATERLLYAKRTENLDLSLPDSNFFQLRVMGGDAGSAIIAAAPFTVHVSASGGFSNLPPPVGDELARLGLARRKLELIYSYLPLTAMVRRRVEEELVPALFQNFSFPPDVARLTEDFLAQERKLLLAKIHEFLTELVRKVEPISDVASLEKEFEDLRGRVLIGHFAPMRNPDAPI